MNWKSDFTMHAQLRDAEWLTAIWEPLGRVEKLLRECVSTSSGRLREVVNYTLSSGGKRIRPVITLLSAQAVGDVNERTIAYAAAIELIHTASLLHDDVIDNAKVRRGMVTANVLWGDSAAIVGGDFLLACAFELLSRYADVHAMCDIAGTAQKMCHGQMLELMHAFDTQMSRDQYLEIVRLKTAELFASACFAGSLSGGAAIEDATRLRNFGLLIGIAFQIVDDLLDIVGSESVLGKPIGQDLKSGKMTLPVIELLEKLRSEGDGPLLKRIEDSLNERSVSDELVSVLQQLIVTHGIDKLVRSYARQLSHSAMEVLKCPPAQRCEALSSIAKFVVDREL